MLYNENLRNEAWR